MKKKGFLGLKIHEGRDQTSVLLSVTKSYSGTMRDISSTWIEYIHNVLWIQPTNPFKKPQAVSTSKQYDEMFYEGAFIRVVQKTPVSWQKILACSKLYRSKLLQKSKFLNNSNKIEICLRWFVRNICMAWLIREYYSLD